MLGKIVLAFFALFIFPRAALASISIEQIVPGEISSSEQEIKLFVHASNLSDVLQFIQAAITKEGKTNYFGFTRNNSGEWIKYDTSPDLNSLLSFSPIDGNWDGEVDVKIDTSDTGFEGSGSYQVKLLKYISSTGQSSNFVPLYLKISAPDLAAVASVNEPSPKAPEKVVEKNIPKIQFSFPGNLKVGEEFEISFTLINFEKGSYFVKARIGNDVAHLGSGQTRNGDWLSDSDSWTRFPVVTGDGRLKVRLPPHQQAGDYKIKISLKNGDKNPIQSDEAPIHFSEGQNQNNRQSAVRPPATSLSGVVLAAKTIIGSSAATDTVISHKEIDLAGTKSSIILNKDKTVRIPDLLIKEPRSKDLPLIELLFFIGGVLLISAICIVIYQKYSQNVPG